MNPLTPERPADAVSHPFLVQLLAGLLLIAAVPVTLWVLADPATAFLTVTAVAAAGLLVVSVLESPADDCNGGR